MKITHVNYDVSSFGITLTSLKMLRDTLAEKFGRRIAVLEIPTSDLCCGYLILDLDWRSAPFTGDGFRTDRGGEGGAGYKTAEALFVIFGIRPLVWDRINLEPLYQGALEDEEVEAYLLVIAQKIADELDDSEFQELGFRPPQYIRGQ